MVKENLRRSHFLPGKIRDLATILSLVLTLTNVHHAQEIVKFTGSDGKRIYSNTEEIYRLIGKLKLIEPSKMIVQGQPTEPDPQIEKLIRQVSEQHGVDPELVRAVAKAESNFNPYAVSYKGAQGIMQLLPGTAKRFGVSNVFDPKQNIEGGVKFLKFLIGMFPDNLPRILAAYNAGENAVVKYRGIPPYRETQAYVRRISGAYNNKNGLLMAANQDDNQNKIVSYKDQMGRVVYTNLESAYR